MIRLEIVNPHLQSKEAIFKTAKYLMGMVGLPMSTDIALLTDRNPEEARQDAPLAELEPAPREEPSNPLENLKKTKAGEFPGYVAEKPQENTDTPLELDANGFPWDERIHSRTRSKTTDGKWRYQRGVTDDTIRTIEALLTPLTQKVNAPIPTPPAYIPPAPIAPLVDVMAPVKEVEPDFQALMNLITAGIKEGKISHPEILKTVQEFGVANFPVVATRPDLIPAIFNRFKQILGA